MMDKGDDIKMRGRRNEKWIKTRGEGSVNGIFQGGGYESTLGRTRKTLSSYIE